MVLNDEILPDDIIRLLYEQQFLNPEDEDYENWNRGLITTFDLLIKKIQKLEITPADLALDPCSGSAVVTDTATGKVLACVSYPGYDNNRLANQMDNKYYYKIYNNASLPLFNRATQQLSAPGSTFKPVTIIAGLEEGVIDESTMVECDGVFDKVDPPLKCWNHAGHGAVNGVDSALTLARLLRLPRLRRLSTRRRSISTTASAMRMLLTTMLPPCISCWAEARRA